MNKPKTPNAKLVATTATLVGSVAGCPFYEHPTQGDESPLLYITKDGRVKLSDFWDLPSYDELPVNALFSGVN